MNSPHPSAADSPAPEPAPATTRTASTKRRRKATGALVIAAGLLGAGAIATAVVPEPQVATAQQDQAALIAEGKSIYDVACITCHGQNLQGVEDRGPSLVGVGAGSVYFQVHSGRMPAADNEAQAERKKPRYSEHQIVALAAYVDQYGGGPGIITNPDGTIAQESLRGVSGESRAEELARGGELFRLNCASCHNFTGRGGALSAGKYAPILDPANEQEIYQAMLTGPQNMPKFSDRQLTPDEKQDIIAYIKNADSKVSPGGYGLGGLGPVTEGVAMWLVGIVALIGATLWIGSRS
ncbi:cytochrome c [Dietzia aurantiaca]|uniref:cytochrome bc1 complex diheme cytochrome c subunit n=1 Tax=Dietzia aurantiaca TaxID=983873 RepID=UPI001E65B9F7|nr:cytochrome c [Dietzia aurantiaca]MCD2262386.1 cytochrome c [Dietzia aurantiaca]